MDSITHIAIGACVGEAFFKKGFGKKAMIWGALAQSIPDIDFITSLWMSTSENLLAHRGFTHSILFALLIVPVFALAADKIHKPHNIRFSTWIFFFATEVFLHLFLDGFNNYGTGWLEPFSHTRFSFNTVYVADFFFSIWPGIAMLMLITLNSYSTKRKFWWKFGLIIPFIYLSYCTVNKIRINRDVKEIFAKQNIRYTRYFTTPAPLQNWLWYIVAGNDSGYYVGFRSVFDSKKEIAFEYFARNDSLLAPVADHEDLQKLIRFSQQFYTVEKYNNTLVFNDLRFGQILGWQNARGRFVFHYYLQHPQDNQLVVQRGRFEGWNRQTVSVLMKRIKGN
ncbi:MAG: metal-dependent hydrolase [Chitinophagaceae bacterium]|nr:metal-dependent hydrolase [Chitinophagaceae bacterium]